MLEIAKADGLTDEQADNVMSRMAAGRYFLQTHDQSKFKAKSKISSKIADQKSKSETNKLMKTATQITNKSKVNAKATQSASIKSVKDFATGTGQCNAANLKTELDTIVASLAYDKAKQALCAAMSNDAFQSAFGNANEALAEHLAGSAEKPWWPIIPPIE